MLLAACLAHPYLEPRVAFQGYYLPQYVPKGLDYFWLYTN